LAWEPDVLLTEKFEVTKTNLIEEVSSRSDAIALPVRCRAEICSDISLLG